MAIPETEPLSFFERMGGTPTFERMVERFYSGVATDPVIRPLYPADLTESKRYLALFLIQYFGGPTTYSQERGHPRLRMRHLPFTIGPTESEAWMRHMKVAVVEEQFPPEISTALLDYFQRVADFMINQQSIPTA